MLLQYTRLSLVEWAQSLY